MWFALAAVAWSSGTPEPARVRHPEDLATAAHLPRAATEPTPKRREAADPQQQVDYTAHTLQFGEVRIGTHGLDVGILPGLQVGTIAPLDAVGIYNLQAKGTIVGPSPVAASVELSHFSAAVGDLHGMAIRPGGTVSVQLTPGWAVHAGASYNALAFGGLPTDTPARLDVFLPSDMLDMWGDEASELGIAPWLESDFFTLRGAMDLHFNARDSVVVQGRYVAGGRVDAGVGGSDVDPLVASTMAQEWGVEPRTKEALGGNWSLAVSYQISWRNVDLRMGGGASSVPLLWIPDANAAAARFGGSSRRAFRRNKRAWRRAGG